MKKQNRAVVVKLVLSWKSHQNEIVMTVRLSRVKKYDNKLGKGQLPPIWKSIGQHLNKQVGCHKCHFKKNQFVSTRSHRRIGLGHNKARPLPGRPLALGPRRFVFRAAAERWGATEKSSRLSSIKIIYLNWRRLSTFVA